MEEQRKQREIAKKLAEFEAFKAESEKRQEEIYREKEQYRMLCGQLYDDGVIKQIEDGTFVAVDDPLERESIRTESKRKQQMSQMQTAGYQQEFGQTVLNEDDSQMVDLK